MKQKVAIVIGGSGGIGAAACRALSSAGLTVLVGYGSNKDAAEAVVASCRELAAERPGGTGDRSGVAESMQIDVTDEDSVAAAVDRAAELGDVSVLVYAAGVADDDLLIRLTAERWDRNLDVNLRGAYLAARAVMRPMLRNRWGRIITLTSIVGLRGNAGQAAYGAAKAGLIGFTKSLAREVSRKGVTVNTVAPGYVETAMTEELPDDLRQKYVDDAPLGRAVTADEVAAAIAFLCTEEAAAITGAVLPVDGGAAI